MRHARATHSGGCAPVIAAVWSAALLDPALPCPAGVQAWNGSDPALRLAVHRNNLVSGLVDGLGLGFPVTQQLIGEAFFRAMAALFVRQQPPRSAVLAHYGDGLAGFIDQFGPASSLPYLADMARLEHARTRACHAADAPVLTAESAAPALASGVRTGALRLVCHPSCGLVASSHAVVSLWEAHQVAGEPSLAAIDLAQAEAALVLRPGLDVHVVSLTPGAAAFVAALLRQAQLADAATSALAADPCFDLTAALRLLMAQGALTTITLPDRPAAHALP